MAEGGTGHERASALDPKIANLILALNGIYDFHRQYDLVRRSLSDAARFGANAQSIEFKKALLTWQEKGDTSAFHALFDEPAGPLRGVGIDTLIKINCAVTDRNFAAAEKVLAADPHPAFEADTKKFACRDFVLGWIRSLKVMKPRLAPLSRSRVHCNSPMSNNGQMIRTL